MARIYKQPSYIYDFTWDDEQSQGIWVVTPEGEEVLIEYMVRALEDPSADDWWEQYRFEGYDLPRGTLPRDIGLIIPDYEGPLVGEAAARVWARYVELRRVGAPMRRTDAVGGLGTLRRGDGSDRPGARYAIEIYESYVGKGAPSNAAGARRGYGLTPAQAHANAGHWANQAPWARVRKIGVSDHPTRQPGSLNEKIAFAVAGEAADVEFDVLPRQWRQAIREIEKGRYATAITRMLEDTATYGDGRRARG